MSFLSSVVGKRCDVNNGDCMHFCETMEAFGAKCSCATGYRLLEDGLSCEPEGINISLNELSAKYHIVLQFYNVTPLFSHLQLNFHVAEPP